MYRHNPQTKRLTELVDGGAIGELRLVRSTFSYSLYDAENIRLRTDVEGGALMDVGCYCVSGSRLLGRRARDRLRPGLVRPDRDRLGLRRHDALPGRRPRASSTAARRCPSATSWRRSAARARCSSTTRGTAASPVIELRRDGGVERIELEPADSYRLELENLSDAIRGEGRQSRALEALHTSAEDARSTCPEATPGTKPPRS